MSAEVRQEIATALSSVDGITAHPYFVQATEPGTALVRLDRVEYPNPFGGVAHWNIVVLLPQDLEAAEKYVEDKVPAIRVAIESLIFVTQVRPQRLDLPGVGVVPCVFITGHREE